MSAEAQQLEEEKEAPMLHKFTWQERVFNSIVPLALISFTLTIYLLVEGNLLQYSSWLIAPASSLYFTYIYLDQYGFFENSRLGRVRNKIRQSLFASLVFCLLPLVKVIQLSSGFFASSGRAVWTVIKYSLILAIIGGILTLLFNFLGMFSVTTLLTIVIIILLLK